MELQIHEGSSYTLFKLSLHLKIDSLRLAGRDVYPNLQIMAGEYGQCLACLWSQCLFVVDTIAPF